MQKTETKKAPPDITRGLLMTALGVGLIGLVVALALFFPRKLAEYVSEGLSLAVSRVLPTAFPFMILTSLVEVYSRPALIGKISAFIGWIFGIPSCTAGALIIGNVSGFPIGAKLSVDLYKTGVVSRSTCERLIAYSNTPSPAFVVGVVGSSLFGSGEIGMLLLISLFAGNIIAAQFFRQKEDKCDNTQVISRQTYSFVESVKSAGSASVTLISFIVIFSVLTGFVRDYVSFLPLRDIIILFLEVTAATSHITSNLTQFPLISIALTAFSLGFGGLSVMAQTSAFTTDTDISVYPYLKIKLISALSSLLVSIILYLIIYIM